MTAPILRFEGVSKRFPGVQALSDVSFDIAAGECHAIMGENGAGKSTLGKIVAGLYQADGGRVLLDGKPTAFRGPLDAAAAGIRIVHQELAFCPNLSVAENLCLGATPNRRGRVQWRIMADRAKEMLQSVGLALDPWTPMSALSTAQEQLCQIAVAVQGRARIIIMDEPTSSLSAGETETLFAILDRLRTAGVTILYVSHRLEEIRRLCDRVTVLRDGRFVETLVTAETTTDAIVQRMVGRPIADYFPAHAAQSPGDVLLAVQNLSGPGGFRDVSLTVRAGEIVGLAGLVGAGRSEVARAVFGVDKISTGVVTVAGQPVTIRAPRDAIAAGVGLLPEDRKRQGLVLTMNCRENFSLAMLGQWLKRRLLDRRRERAETRDYFAKLRVKTPAIDADIAGLSGGNQQKIALAKWLARQCRVLILDEPTRGVDVGAKAEIHALIDDLAAQGRGVLLISSDLPEVLNLSTRVVVMAGGRVAGELPRGQATQERVMKLMAGVN